MMPNGRYERTIRTSTRSAAGALLQITCAPNAVAKSSATSARMDVIENACPVMPASSVTKDVGVASSASKDPVEISPPSDPCNALTAVCTNENVSSPTIRKPKYSGASDLITLDIIGWSARLMKYSGTTATNNPMNEKNVSRR